MDQEQEYREQPLQLQLELQVQEPVLTYTERTITISTRNELRAVERGIHRKITMNSLKCPKLPDLPLENGLINTLELVLHVNEQLWREYIKYYEPKVIRKLTIIGNTTEDLHISEFSTKYLALEELEIRFSSLTFTLDKTITDFILSISSINRGNLTIDDRRELKSLTMTNILFDMLPIAQSITLNECSTLSETIVVSNVVDFTSEKMMGNSTFTIKSKKIKTIKINSGVKVKSRSTFDITVNSGAPSFLVDLYQASNVRNIIHECWDEARYSLNENCSASFTAAGIIPVSAFPLRLGSKSRMTYKVKEGSETTLEQVGTLTHGIQKINYYQSGRAEERPKDWVRFTRKKLYHTTYGGRVNDMLPEETVKKIASSYYPCPDYVRCGQSQCVYEDTKDIFCDDDDRDTWTWEDSMNAWKCLMEQKRMDDSDNEDYIVEDSELEDCIVTEDNYELL